MDHWQGQPEPDGVASKGKGCGGTVTGKGKSLDTGTGTGAAKGLGTGTITSKGTGLGVVLEAKLLNKAVLLKNAVNALTGLYQNVNFNYSDNGLQLREIDCNKEVFLSLLLRVSAFSEFKCDRAISLGMNVDSLVKVFKTCGPDDSLKVSWQDNDNAVIFHLEDNDTGKIAAFELKLLHIRDDNLSIPEQQHKSLARLPSAVFQKVCQAFQQFGGNMQIETKHGAIGFSMQGDYANIIRQGRVTLQAKESDNPEEKIALTVHETVTATFALQYLVRLSKAALLCSTVELGLGPDSLLCVKYVFENVDNGYLQFHIASDEQPTSLMFALFPP